VPAFPAPEEIPTVILCAALVPQELDAFTVMFPPELVEVVVMLFVAEVPDHPAGSVHI
jgi:hypothetical protein